MNDINDLFSSSGELQYLWGARPSWGNDNNVWKKADLSFIAANDRTEFRLIIEATVAEGQHGDIAIDDVSFTPGCRYVQCNSNEI